MDMHKRITHIINHLKGLGKIFDEEEVNVKALKSLNRRYKPTMTTITESKNLAQMTSVELFGKLREYEMNMTRMVEEEQKDKKVKGLTLKMEDSSSEDKCSKNEEKSKSEELNLMEKKSKFRSKKKKAYIAWDDNASTTSSDSEQEQGANLCLMIKHESDHEVSDSDSSTCSYNQLQDAFSELYVEAKKMGILNKIYEGKIKELELKVSSLEKENEILTIEVSKLKLPCVNCKNLYIALKFKENEKVDWKKLNFKKSMTPHFSCNYYMKPRYNYYNTPFFKNIIIIWYLVIIIFIIIGEYYFVRFE
uniref:UBN2 domain-containing protein n=1 Tax=Cajanus cajan TaxID=3821 RepID=A0A151S7W9_CAJCA|nr:hypothetical protein KK1_027344 [Cajanus cajan]